MEANPVDTEQQAWEKFADICQAQGGVVLAVASIPSGAQDDALHSAKALGDLVHDSDAVPALADEGTVRALLQVLGFNVSKLEDKRSLQCSQLAIVKACPAVAAQIVAAYNNPDLEIAFAAIRSTGILLEQGIARAHLFQAGAARALVDALSHDCPECRGAAAAAVAAGATDLEMLSALRDAGLVPAMMELIRRGPASSPSQSRPGLALLGDTTAVIWGLAGGELHVPWADAGPIACRSLAALCDAHPDVALEIVKAARPASAILSCLRQSGGHVAAPSVGLLFRVVGGLDGPLELAFGQELVAEGFPDLFPSLIRPASPELAGQAICTLCFIFNTAGFDCIGHASTETIMTALEQFLGSDSAGDGEAAQAAVYALYKMSSECWPPNLDLARRHLPDNAINKASRLLVTCTDRRAVALCVLCVVMAQLKQGSYQAEANRLIGKPFEAGRTNALAVAVSGGFIPGVVNMVRWVGKSYLTETPEGGGAPSSLASGGSAARAQELHACADVKLG